MAKQVLRDELSKPETLARLRVSPKPMLELAFATAHRAIEAHFQAVYEDQGWIVTRAPEGYLLRSRGTGGAPLCVHGGTTATVLIVLDGRRLIVSNVGDSTAIISGLGAAGKLHPIEDWVPATGGSSVGLPTGVSQGAGAAVGAGAGAGAPAAALPAVTPLPVSYGQVAGAPPTSSCAYSAAAALSRASYVPVPAEVASSYMELSADHSPESHTEFLRMHRYRPCTAGEGRPELLFVYDTLTASKLSCPPIFEADGGGNLGKTERGSYYKNVRCEWATLVATPPHAPFQDALAFTRSLGDLHLQTYGVSHEPETWWMELTQPTAAAAAAPGAAGDAAAADTALVPHPVAIVLASDGIWDNWKFEEVAAFSLTPERVARVATSGSALAPTAELMAANLERGHANFGSSADNMTVLTLYLFPKA